MPAYETKSENIILPIKRQWNIIPDRKTLSAKGKLTEKVINSMQNYYGLAIGNNKNQLFNMKNSIGAVLYQ